MQDAKNEFKGTSEETRISVADVDLLLNRGDIDNALALLKKIDPSQPYYVEAREKMASIYLKYRKDKRMYAATYKLVFDDNHNLILLHYIICMFLSIKGNLRIDIKIRIHWSYLETLIWAFLR